jgi:hypothetical protein
MATSGKKTRHSQERNQQFTITDYHRLFTQLLMLLSSPGIMIFIKQGVEVQFKLLVRS